ncbi:MAG: prolipoprotein diacylglyceryl transferase [Anaerolineae bacterium]|nr:prolipoprotein diacylglyceryl transferase [Anaerolineae bacterium]
MSIDQYGIHLGPLYIRFYALIAISGALIAAWIIAVRAKRRGLDPNHVWDGLFWALIPGLIGARLYHVLTPSPSMMELVNGQYVNPYFQNPLRIFEIWNGGLGIYGGIVGGVIGIYIYARRYKQPILQWLDLVAPAVALAQAIGRWGNLINQELYGAPTDLPWAIYIPPEKRLPEYLQFERFHPLFLYESLWNLAAFFLLIWISNRYQDRLKRGDIVLMYLMQYPLVRFLLDFVRLDSNGSGVLTTAQVVSLATFVFAGAVLLWRHRDDWGRTSEALATPEPQPATVKTTTKASGSARSTASKAKVKPSTKTRSAGSK